MKRFLFTIYNIALFLCLLLLLSSSCCYSQKKIFFNPDTTKYMRVSCYYANTDISGSPEHTRWLIFQQLSPSSNIIFSDTTCNEISSEGIFSVISRTAGSFSYTYYRVFAVDSAYNYSAYHLSTGPSAAFGGWILVPDKSLPSSPDTLNVSF